MERDYGVESVREVLSLVWCSQSGLSETEVLELTGSSRLELSRLLFALGIRLIKTRTAPLKRIGLSLHLLILIQVILGIGLLHSAVAIVPAALHQFVAVLVLLHMVALWPYLMGCTRCGSGR